MYDVESIWRGMKARCYSSNDPAYADCIVCREWLNNYKMFENWFIDNLYDCGSDKLQLDKDLFSNGDKIYSPETCCLLPGRINALISYKRNRRYPFPTGVNMASNGKYVATVRSGSGHVTGTFQTVSDAAEFYAKNKERYIKRLAVAYERYLPGKIYDALMNYKCEPF